MLAASFVRAVFGMLFALLRAFGCEQLLRAASWFLVCFVRLFNNKEDMSEYFTRHIHWFLFGSCLLCQLLLYYYIG